jgi:hypothetical protein
MPISLVQSKQATTTTTTTVEATFDSAPTQNNLMVGTVSSNDGSFTNPSGWSTAIENYNVTDDDIQRIIYKVAGAGESSTVQCTAFAGNTKHLGISEWSGIVTASPLDLTASSAVTAGVTSISSGTTGTINSGNELAVAVFAIRADTSAESVNNSFTVLNTGNGTFSDFSAYRIYASQTTVETTGSWTTAGTAWGSVATFLGAGGIGPLFMGA